MLLQLPEQLKLGAALSALQTEGGETGSAWEEFSLRKGKIRDGTRPQDCGAHYERYMEDAALARSLGLAALRTSVSWARVMPKRGAVSEEALSHYKKECEALEEAGVEPIITLHHFDEPLWFLARGGFLAPTAQEDFLFFVKSIAGALGNSVKYYITFNEPNIYALNGYLYGLWPPEKHSPFAARRVLTNMALCHIAAYRLLHELRPDVIVSAAPHMRAFEPLCRAYNAPARLCETLYQTRVTDAFIRGEFSFPFDASMSLPGTYADCCAFNYYTSSLIGDFRLSPKGRAVNDLGWEISPEGLTKVCRSLFTRYGLPLLVAENGVCDETDAYRPRFIFEHLKALVSSGAPVTHYLYWSLLDNFEWREGMSARFGLLSVDLKTGDRSCKPSALFYQDIIKNRGVTDAAAKRYGLGQKYPFIPRDRPDPRQTY